MTNKKTNTSKSPVSETSIFKTMLMATFGVAALFFLKNVISQTWISAAIIGVCLLIFSGVIFYMKKAGMEQEKKQFIICISIVLLVFVISLNSGNFYSDDFPLYLAVIGLSGLYLVPRYTIVQMVLIDILLIAAYVIHPEKADPLSQYLMCVAIFTVAAYSFYMVIKRGRAYIEIGYLRAKEAEELLSQLKNAGEELQNNCGGSASRIAKFEEANQHLLETANSLRAGSADITQGTVEVTETFKDVQERMHVTQQQINSLNTEVNKVEQSLDSNKQNMHGMEAELERLRRTIEATGKVFSTLQEEIREISTVTTQLTKISSDTTMLALNASIEAARAGQAGAGFAVVANKVQDLAENSNNCSAQVVSVIKAMQQRIDETTQQLADSNDAINLSIASLGKFQDSFDALTSQFNSLYRNIEEQNDNVQQMDSIFDELQNRISDMAASSEANENSVTAINDAIDIYKDNMNLVIDDNRVINELSASMLELSNSQVD